MTNNLFKHFEKNEEGSDYVVGDIHGCFDALRGELIRIGFDEAVDRLFCVGDLVDRGRQSEESLAWLSLPWVHCVRGNHEQMAIDCHNGLIDKRLYIQNGGAWFLSLPESEQQDYALAFRGLPIAMDIETDSGLVGIVHAEPPFDSWDRFRDILSGSDEERIERASNHAMWARTRISYESADIVKDVDMVFVGHTPIDEPMRLGNVLYIDTGCVFGRKLSVFRINGEQV